MKKIVIENKEQGIRIEYPAEFSHRFMLLTKDNPSKAICTCEGFDGKEKFKGVIIDLGQIRGIRTLLDSESKQFKLYQKSKP